MESMADMRDMEKATRAPNVLLHRLILLESQVETAGVRQRALEGENVRLRHALVHSADVPVVPETLLRNVAPSELAALRRSFLAHAENDTLGPDGWPIGTIDLDLLAPLLIATRGTDDVSTAFQWPSAELRKFVINRLQWGGSALSFADVLRVYTFVCERPGVLETMNELRSTVAARERTVAALNSEVEELRVERVDYMAALVPKLRESHERMVDAAHITEEAREAMAAVGRFAAERASWAASRTALEARCAALELDNQRATRVLELVGEVERVRKAAGNAQQQQQQQQQQ